MHSPSLIRRLLLLCTLLPAFAIPARAEDEAGAKLSAKIADFAFIGEDGKPTSLYAIKEKKAIVVVFLNFECPNSNGYSTVLAEMAKSYAPKGVAFLGFCSCEEDAATVRKQAAGFHLGFPVSKDEKNAAVGALKAELTPEAFLLDHNFILRYRGRIDDGYAARLKKNLVVKSQDLQKALDEVVAGHAVTTPLTRAVGCRIGVAKDVKKDGKVTYYRDVLPILQNRCQSCHRPDEVGPFSLVTFKQAVNWASDIKDYTASRQMPPWKITKGTSFKNERSMPEKEIETLAAWADSGTPEGNPKDAPPQKDYADGWMLGKPDLVVEAKEDFVVGAGGPDVFRCFVLPTGLTEDKYIVAYQVKPGNPRVVHHTLNFFDCSGKARQLESTFQANEKASKPEVDCGPGYGSKMGPGFFGLDPKKFGSIGGWAPGQLPPQLPEGYGWLLPRESDVVMQVHYHRDGRLEKDRPRIGFYFAKKTEGIKPFKAGFIAGGIVELALGIPAGNDHFKVAGTSTVNVDCTLYSIMPHMHLLGKSIKVVLKAPDAQPETLLQIDNWDYNWQESYFLKTPLALKKGSTLSLEAIYDNSAKNPNNPNAPPQVVKLGEQTTNEMCFVFFGVTADTGGLLPISGFNFGGRKGMNRLEKKP